jgi:hypothetical protein
MRSRRVTALAVVYFAASTVMLVAPVYTVLGNRVQPRLWGLPWSLVYVLLVVVANFAVLMALYRGRYVDHLDDDTDADADADADADRSDRP